MPIQIRELIVTATVEEQVASKKTPSTKAESDLQVTELKAEILQACMDEVMKVFQQQRRR
jgi:hypothetical protein